MSTMLPSTDAPSPWRRWVNFWFHPADPATMAFVRIRTGLLVLYIHLAYSVDLQAFFGKHAWFATDSIDKERREAPGYMAPLFDWDASLSFPRLPDYPHRRQALMDFLRALPDQKAE